jgi:TlyA family rRNA methyltransferase/putative hemolysin
VALTQLLQRRHPKLENATELVVAGRVVVDGASITNLNATVRSDASIRVLTPRRLRGELKLAAALDAFRLSVAGAVAVDIGAAAGGFTSALLDRGAARVYAVDVGFGQLAGRLRADDRVVNLERTNVASLDTDIVPEVVDLVTIDLSYLPVAEAVPSLRRLRLASDAALVSPHQAHLRASGWLRRDRPPDSPDGHPARRRSSRSSRLATEGVHGPCGHGSWRSRRGVRARAPRR